MTSSTLENIKTSLKLARFIYTITPIYPLYREQAYLGLYPESLKNFKNTLEFFRKLVYFFERSNNSH